jgi:hypothetical protein
MGRHHGGSDLAVDDREKEKKEVPACLGGETASGEEVQVSPEGQVSPEPGQVNSPEPGQEKAHSQGPLTAEDSFQGT